MKYNWKIYTLDQVCERIYSGGTPSTKHSEYWNGDLKWLSSGETSQRFIYDTERKITQEGVNHSTTKLATKGCTVIATAGQGFTRGQASFLMTDTYMNQSVIACKANEDFVLPLFLYYNLDSRYEEFRLLSDGTSTRGGLSGWILKRMEINLPPIEEQKRISALLRVIDKRIELNTAINDNLEQQAQAIFQSWFIDFEPFGYSMPADWETATLDTIADFQNGYAFKSKELLNEPAKDTYQVFKQGHINRGGGFLPDGTKSWYPKSSATNLNKFVLKKGDILMAMTDMKDNVAILGNTAIMPLDDEFIVNQRVGHLRANGYKGITYPYIYLLTNSKDFLTDLRSRANSGVQVNLSSTAIKSSKTVIATEDINVRFSAIVMPMFEQIIQNQLENQRLSILRDTLLPKLMSGELDVSNIDL